MAWGNDGDGESQVPDSAKADVIQVSAGGYHSVALKSDGTAVTWGSGAEDVMMPDVDPRMAEMLTKPIEELDLSVRSANCLKNANIRTLGDLVQRRQRTLLG